jgi:hypothetical protein
MVLNLETHLTTKDKDIVALVDMVCNVQISLTFLLFNVPKDPMGCVEC